MDNALLHMHMAPGGGVEGGWGIECIVWSENSVSAAVAMLTAGNYFVGQEGSLNVEGRKFL